MSQDERALVQDPLIRLLCDLAPLGYRYVPGVQLKRQKSDPFLEDEVRAALIRLNPLIAAEPSRAEGILHELRRVALSANSRGLLAANETMTSWLRGQESRGFAGLPGNKCPPIKLIDFDNPSANVWMVSDEVVLATMIIGGVATTNRRLDIVLWCNGFPLVSIETKSPTDAMTSWLQAARDLAWVYVREAPSFFVSNLLMGAIDGREFHYGALGQPIEEWLPWRSSAEDDMALAPLARSLHHAELLLAPAKLLEILWGFTIFSRSASGSSLSAALKAAGADRGGWVSEGDTSAQTPAGVGAARAPRSAITKILPRYPQVEAVAAVVKRVQEGIKKRGLICHYQGTGKTLLIGFAAAALRRKATGLNAPTILLLVDRNDLSEQTESELRAAAMFPIRKAETRKGLRKLLAEDDARGVILATIQLFDQPDLLSDRSNIVVMPDEAHRSQEGIFGANLRASLPNATLFGFTGTPISTGDHDTYETFGDPSDPNGILHLYSIDRSIEDRMTVPVRVETRPVTFDIDRATLDAGYDKLATQEGLNEDQKERVAREVARRKTVEESPEHIRAICTDVLDDLITRRRPLGLKGQIVVPSRKLCTLYDVEFRKQIAERGLDLEVAVVMTVDRSKDIAAEEAKGDEEGKTPTNWAQYELSPAAEAKIKRRFRDVGDKLSLLIVTAKLLTGFDAKINGVLYLAKELHLHTLGQAVARVNRRWTNPLTGQEKDFGLVIDYIGLSDQIALSMSLRGAHAPALTHLDVSDMIADFDEQLAASLERFGGIDRSDIFSSLLEAQNRLGPAAQGEIAVFNAEFLRLQATWEFLMPDVRLRPFREDYKWLARLFSSLQTIDTTKLLLERVGAKTRALVAENISNVRIGPTVVGLELDAKTARQLGEILGPGPGGRRIETLDDALKSIEFRVKRLLARGGKTPLVYESIARKLELLRAMTIASAKESIEYMARLLDLAREVTEAEKLRESLEDSILPDQKLGALTQLFYEFRPEATPEIVGRFVMGVDEMVGAVRFSGWQEKKNLGEKQVAQTLRKLLDSFGLAKNQDLFERAMAYIRENY